MVILAQPPAVCGARRPPAPGEAGEAARPFPALPPSAASCGTAPFAPQFVPAVTGHARRGAIRHAFRQRLDMVLIDPELVGPAAEGPFFARNRFALASVRDRDHGGVRGAGEGAAWARRALDRAGLAPGYGLRLLTQPRWLGAVFNPVSFWLALRGEALVAVICEVDNTFGDRHSYLCARPGFAPIGPRDRLTAAKVLHVSPFQDVAGGYDFAFDLRPDRIAIRIVHRNGREGVAATLEGPRRPMTAPALLRAALRFPFAGLRAIALIHWHALRLWAKGARYRPRPEPPAGEIT